MNVPSTTLRHRIALPRWLSVIKIIRLEFKTINMKKIFTLLFCVLFLNQFAQSDKQILEFTKANYLKLIGQMPENKAADFGFANKDEILNLSFTKVFAEYILVNNIPTKTNNYRVLALNANGKPKGLFTIYNNGTELMVADYGALELSKTLSCSTAGFDPDSQLSILRIFTTQSDYVFDSKIPEQSRKYLKLFENNLYSLTDIKKD
jgi:hypothetical protein